MVNFRLNGKKAMVVLFFKKVDMHLLKDYRKISVPLITGKVFERLFYNHLECFIRNDLISQNHSGFKPGNSCVNQILAFGVFLVFSFGVFIDVRPAFLDMSKAFDRV